MTHHIYRTLAIVITTTPVAEANRHYYLLTRDLGVIGATAQGVRLSKSKLKFGLQPLSLAQISLVKGKQGWKIVNALPEKSYYQQFKNAYDAQGVVARVLALVRRLVQGEEVNERLYATVIDHFQFLEQQKDLTAEDILLIEYSLVLSILHLLGYMPDSELAKSIVNESISRNLIDSMRANRKSILAQINQSLKETQL